MYEKPKKHKQKSTHHSNKRITEYFPCECGRTATQTHEWFGNSKRTKAAKMGAQSKLCGECHRWYHEKKDRWLPHQIKHQERIMIEQKWGREDWKREFGENFLSDTELTSIQTAIMKELELCQDIQ